MLHLEPTTSLAHNIATAVFRVGRIVRHDTLRRELEAAAVVLVADISAKEASRLDRLVRLAEAVGEMNPINQQVLCRELGNLRDMLIHELREELPESDAVEIEDLFARKLGGTPRSRGSAEPGSARRRQAAVLEFIRQFPGDCRMKDLVEAFPRVSERTLRNDVKRLIRNGSIERRGGKGGPASYFRVAVASRESENSTTSERILLPEAPSNISR